MKGPNVPPMYKLALMNTDDATFRKEFLHPFFDVLSDRSLSTLTISSALGCPPLPRLPCWTMAVAPCPTAQILFCSVPLFPVPHSWSILRVELPHQG